MSKSMYYFPNFSRFNLNLNFSNNLEKAIKIIFYLQITESNSLLFLSLFLLILHSFYLKLIIYDNLYTIF
jgi:hypothetical protein